MIGKESKKEDKKCLPHKVSDKSKVKTVYEFSLLVERISPLNMRWFEHLDEPYILETLSDGQKHTPTGITVKIGKRYGRTCYKETVRKILFIWKRNGIVKHENVNGYDYFWLEKNSPNGEKLSM